jgi:hypothetical protein
MSAAIVGQSAGPEFPIADIPASGCIPFSIVNILEHHLLGLRQGGGCLGETIGNYWVQDEGDLLVASRETKDDEQIEDILSKKANQAKKANQGGK